MTDIIDKGGAIHAGEELDLAAVDRWLKPRIPGLEGNAEVTQYSGGASNWTYRLAYPSHDLILRRAPAGRKAKGAHDMGREYRIQKALAPVFPYVPEMLAHCDDEAVIGAEFYVMRRLEGIIPRRNLPRGLELSEAQTRQLCTNALDRLVELHQVDIHAAGLDQLGKGSGYVRRQIEGWNKRYTQARTWNVPKATKVMRWLEDNIPKREIICMTHNDFRFDNMVLDAEDPTNILGILDWELSALGDPLMELGATMAYWTQADDDFIARSVRRQPTHLPGMMSRDEVVAYYTGKMGLKIDNWVFYEVYGYFRLAGIIQQIYYRYHHKQTRNPAFKNFWIFVNYLVWRSQRAIRKAKA